MLFWLKQGPDVHRLWFCQDMASAVLYARSPMLTAWKGPTSVTHNFALFFGVLTSTVRHSERPQGVEEPRRCLLVLISQALFYLGCKLTRCSRLEMDARPLPVHAFSGFFDYALRAPLRMTSIRDSPNHSNEKMWVTERTEVGPFHTANVCGRWGQHTIHFRLRTLA